MDERKLVRKIEKRVTVTVDNAKEILVNMVSHNHADNNKDTDKTLWCVDSGAEKFTCNDGKLLRWVKEDKTRRRMVFPNGERMRTSLEGLGLIRFFNKPDFLFFHFVM